MASRAKVVSLYQQARLTFAKKKGPKLDRGFSEELKKLQYIVNNLTAADFKITEDIAKSEWNYSPYVTNSPAACMEVFECPDFSIALFLIKPRMSIPLHDHPGMHGIMKVLLGSMTVTSYSRSAVSAVPHCGGSFSANVVSKTIYNSQTQPCCLEPQNGNLHEISTTGDNSVVFLDILGPPYNPKSGIDCTYYYRANEAEQGYIDSCDISDTVQLQPGPNPSWFTCIPLVYPGPEVKPPLA